VLSGYFFGGREFVKKNFSLVILAIIAISLLPAVIGFISARVKKNEGAPSKP
jgi:membrane-associated protein